ncbi:MAG: DUF805 domain-containing protein [Pseudomonadota bacterium]
MGPVSALTTSFTRSFNFSGRASRSEFWWTWSLLYPAVWVIRFLRNHLVNATWFDGTLTVLLWIIAVPMIAVGTRRLVDAGVWPWLFVLVVIFGLVAQFLYSIPVPSSGSLDGLMVQFDDEIVPASEIGYYPYLLWLHDIMPWVGRPLAILCLLVALLPSRETRKGPDPLEAT